MANIINRMRPIHLGEVLHEEFLQPLGMTPHALAMALQVPAPRMNDVVGLQTDFDMATARAAMADVLFRIVSREVVAQRLKGESSLRKIPPLSSIA